ncbi:MAG: NAD(P)/FAD-dependent oxidoreductase [Spirochaetales bacterium]|nr:NAD(P)/FAD-dependent oxidoreductase [Spirochaetales bacterium]
MDRLNKIRKKIGALSPDIRVTRERGCIVLRGEVDDWSIAVKAGHAAVDKKHSLGVINDIRLKGFEQKTSLPALQDRALDGRRVDVLIIGAGITGCAAARELSAFNLSTLVVDKMSDVAGAASGANGGVVHVGINFSRKSQKHYYNIRGNRMYRELSRQLDVPFEQKGQTMLCSRNWERIPVALLKLNARILGIPGVRYLKRSELLDHEPHLPDFAIGGMHMPTGGITNPHEMTAAMAENAASNGTEISLNTAVLEMELYPDSSKESGNTHIRSVLTNRGRIYPRLVINATGVYADTIAQMAGDRTFTIHPRRGTNIITDKRAGYQVKSSMGKSPFSILPYQQKDRPRGLAGRMKFFINTLAGSSHTKGAGLIHSLHGNMLVGPNAVETPDREDRATRADEVESIIRMQQHIAEDLKFSDVIAYFTGVRASTYEEDFAVRRGIFTDNILQAAGIQSPGVTAAPAIAVDLRDWAIEYLEKEIKVDRNPAFSPIRKAVPRTAEMSDEERDALIRSNPDYGEIVCRCEEISRGEIIDALNSPLCVPTVDGIKKRLRPGMGRCQGGFCGPLVMKIISEHQGTAPDTVRKGSDASVICYGGTKGGRL